MASANFSRIILHASKTLICGSNWMVFVTAPPSRLIFSDSVAICAVYEIWKKGNRKANKHWKITIYFQWTQWPMKFRFKMKWFLESFVRFIESFFNSNVGTNNLAILTKKTFCRLIYFAYYLKTKHNWSHIHTHTLVVFFFLTVDSYRFSNDGSHYIQIMTFLCVCV